MPRGKQASPGYMVRVGENGELDTTVKPDIPKDDFDMPGDAAAKLKRGGYAVVRFHHLSEVRKLVGLPTKEDE